MMKGCAEFEKTEALIKDSVRLSVTRKNGKQLKCSQGKVTFEKGIVCKETAHRLMLGTSNVLKFGSLRNQAITLDKTNFCGIVYNSNCRRVVYSLAYCPSITVVTVECSVVLTFTGYNETKRNRKFEAWKEILRKELNFVGCWSVFKVKLNDLDIESTETATLLCATDSRLSILMRNEAGLYESRFSIDFKKMRSSKKSVESHHGEVHVEVTLANENRSALDRLSFSLKDYPYMASTLFDILNKVKIPAMAPVLDPERCPRSSASSSVPVPVSVSVPVSLRGGGQRKSEVQKRISRDDLDLLPLVPRRHFHWNRRRMQKELYDLNAISCKTSVQDALHFYENLQVFRERNPPDVVLNRPSPVETEEYWGIVNTLTEILRKRCPEPDTLNLPPKLRMKLCFLLLDNSLQSWKDLAGYIGLTQDSVRMTETLFQSGMELNPINAGEVITPPECIFRHWQFGHNQHSRGLQAKAPPFPCCLASLIEILEMMERYDLVSLLQQQQRQQQQQQEQQREQQKQQDRQPYTFSRGQVTDETGYENRFRSVACFS